MKKKLHEQKEKAIIESFAKTFNKIKRIDENELNEIVGPVPTADINITYVGAPNNINDEKIYRCVSEAEEAVKAVLKDVFGVPINFVKVKFNGESWN